MIERVGRPLATVASRLLPLRIIQRLKRWLYPSSAWPALLGVDGSGKSSVLEQIQEVAEEAGYAGVYVIHRRPNLLFPRTLAGRSGLIEHYGKPAHGSVLSALKLFVLWLDWWLGYLWLIRPRRARGVLVISDRHSLLDMVVDPLRYRYGGALSWIRVVARWVPMPDAFIVLDAPVKVLRARKQEVSAEMGVELRSRYLDLVREAPRGFTVDASRPLREVTGAVWEKIRNIEEQFK